MTEPCRLIGILDNGAEGLSAQALRHVQEADVVIGGQRTLALFAAQLRPHAQTHDLGARLTQVPGWIEQARAAGHKTVVLATGDPLCHGIGKYLSDKLGRDALAVLPNVSTLQLAAARLRLPWQDAAICSVHSKDAGEWTPGAGPGHGLYALLQALGRHHLIALFTSPENTPARVARMLLSEGLDAHWRMAVVERILQADERVLPDLSIAQAAQQDFADPNIVLLWRTAPHRPEVRFGLADESYLQRKPEKGLITKREVRAVSLARLQLRADSIVWDIGAGSGAVGLEAARLCPDGHVYAIEKNTEDAAIAGQNRARLCITNYSLTHAKAPQGLEAWPDPDAIFIGGSGGELQELVRLCLQRLKPDGWLVMNFVTLENQADALSALKACGAMWDVTQIQAARSQPILHMHRLAAENPVWVVCAQKGVT
ncbi:MAG: precorrin-6y C5,15-methyltransferase (decarboxylating) subunit CbiE [Thiobacillus sp.]